jgi:hypothetical protein
MVLIPQEGSSSVKYRAYFFLFIDCLCVFEAKTSREVPLENESAYQTFYQKTKVLTLHHVRRIA